MLVIKQLITLKFIRCIIGYLYSKITQKRRCKGLSHSWGSGQSVSVTSGMLLDACREHAERWTEACRCSKGRTDVLGLRTQRPGGSRQWLAGSALCAVWRELYSIHPGMPSWFVPSYHKAYQVARPHTAAPEQQPGTRESCHGWAVIL